MKKLNDKKGISLIVLVITIIVMIVLASAIILSLQSAGVIGKANKATVDTNEANMLQAANVAYGEYMLDRDLGKIEANVTAESYVKEKLEGTFTQDKLDTLNVFQDGTTQILPTIPTGFTVSIYEGEQKISDGLVVYKTNAATLATKTQAEAQTTYDQYVWVPVEGDFEQVNWQNEQNFEDKYAEPSEFGYPTELAEYNKMKASVEKNGGFYIARYEAGLPTGITTSTATTTDKPVSLKGATVWNKVEWGYDMADIGTKGAVHISQRLYKENETGNVVSTLIYGVQWDAVMNFMSNVTNINDKNKLYIYDSTGMGYHTKNSDYTNIEGMVAEAQPTGVYAVKNIYDMAGNVSEWTMEGAGRRYRTYRGGYYGSSGSGAPASIRSMDHADGARSDSVGFRVALYIK